MRRKVAFNAVLLSEAVRLLPVDAAVLVLRVVSHALRGLTTITAFSPSSDVCSDGSSSDAQSQQAITWAEAIVDAHFAALAVNAGSGSDHNSSIKSGSGGATQNRVRRALFYGLQAVTAAEQSTEETQALIGAWTHTYRVIHSGSQQITPPLGLHQIEHLTM